MKIHLESPKLDPKVSSFSELVELPVADLSLLDSELPKADATALELYSIGCKLYMLGRVQELEAHLELVKSAKEERTTDINLAVVALLLEMRLKVRNRSLTKGELEALLGQAPQGAESALLAELSFVTAQAYELFLEHKTAYELFREASSRYEAASCFKKACRSKLNSLANYSCLKTDADLVSEYLTLADRAEACGELTSVGVAKINVSREFQRQGSFPVALKYCEEALEALKSEKGTQHKGFALLQKAHILHDLKKNVEALRWVQEAKLFPFAEVKDAATVLEKKITHKTLNMILKNLVPTWKERFQEFFMSLNSVAHVNLEQKVISLLGQGPRDKFDLIEELYGTQESFFLLENRLKNLLNRIRRKYPGQLHFNDNKYHFKAPFELNN